MNQDQIRRASAVQEFLTELEGDANDYPDTDERLKAMGVSGEVLHRVREIQCTAFYDGAVWALDKLT